MNQNKVRRTAWKKLIVVAALLVAVFLIVPTFVNWYFLDGIASDSYKDEVFEVSIPVKEDYNDTIGFFKELAAISGQYGEDLMLGEIMCTAKGDEVTAKITYGKQSGNSSESGVNVILYYDVNSRKIFKIVTAEGSYKLCTYVGSDMDISSWKLTMGEAAKKFSLWHEEQGGKAYERMEIMFGEEEAEFKTFLHASDDFSDLEFAVPMK